MKDKRIISLNSLLDYDKDIGIIKNDLSVYRWDSDEDLVVLNLNHALSVLERYLDNGFTEEEIEGWANTIEGREDVGYGNEHLRELIHELANPILATPLSQHTARRWIIKLENLSS